MLTVLREKLREVLTAIAPLVAVACLVQFAIAQAPFALFLQFLVGSLLAAVGMLLLFTGIDLGVLPMGRFVGAELPKRGSLALILAVAFLLGFATTVAEPDVLVLASQLEAVSRRAMSGQALIYAIATGVAVFAALAMARVVSGWPMKYLLTAAYALALALSFLAPPEFVSLAFDAGSVTTGVLSAPVLIALALGFSSVLAGRSGVSDGFGLLGLASAGPIIVVLLMGMLLS